jgi:hypothetical protein
MVGTMITVDAFICLITWIATWENNTSTPTSAIPGVKCGKLIVVRLPGVVEFQIQVLPSRDIIMNATLPQP